MLRFQNHGEQRARSRVYAPEQPALGRALEHGEPLAMLLELVVRLGEGEQRLAGGAAVGAGWGLD